MRRFLCALVAGLMVVAGFGQTSAEAQPESCPQHFVGGTSPAVLKPQLAQGTQALCYEQFAVLHSGVVRTPLWSAEHLTRDQVEAASQLKRRNAFHHEARLPPQDRAELADYARSGYDRGHMSPSGDMSTTKAQRQSFSLANMIPQHPCNNEVLWGGIESAVRDLASAEGEIYVVTGPIYEGTDIPFLNGRVGVPSLVYKAVSWYTRLCTIRSVAPQRPMWRQTRTAWPGKQSRSTNWPRSPGLIRSRRFHPRSRRWQCHFRPLNPISVVGYIE